MVKTSVIEADGDKSKISLTVKKHGVVYFEFAPASITSDRGYDYDFNYGK